MSPAEWDKFVVQHSNSKHDCLLLWQSMGQAERETAERVEWDQAISALTYLRMAGEFLHTACGLSFYPMTRYELTNTEKP